MTCRSRGGGGGSRDESDRGPSILTSATGVTTSHRWGMGGGGGGRGGGGGYVKLVKLFRNKKHVKTGKRHCRLLLQVYYPPKGRRGKYCDLGVFLL